MNREIKTTIDQTFGGDLGTIGTIRIKKKRFTRVIKS